MGEWLSHPWAENIIAERISRFGSIPRGRGWRVTGVDKLSGLASNFDKNDIANMADVAEAPLWECELPRFPSTDDGF